MSTPEQQPLVIRGPRDVVTAIPCLLGFHPADSLVAVGSDGPGGPTGTCALRMDLTASAPGAPPGTAGTGSKRRDEVSDEAPAQAAGHLAAMLSANGFRSALLVGYGPDDLVAPMMEAARTALAGAGIELKDALRVEGDRFWSYLCTEPSCCPAEGSPFDFRASAAAASTVAGGKVVLSGRAELIRSVAPVDGADRRAMRRATDRAERRLLGWVREGAAPAAVRDRMVAEGLPLVRSLGERIALAGDPAAAARPPDDEIARLGVLLTHLRVRDEAWVRIGPEHLDRHIAFWRTVLRRVDPAYAAAPGALLAYAAFVSGDGGLANVALDRALEARPGYSMAELIREVMFAGVPPSKAMLRMTPGDLANAYDERSRSRADGLAG